MPENARPTASGDAVRIDRANAWFEKNAVGKRLKDLHYFEHVLIKKAVGNRRSVLLLSNENNKINAVGIPGVDAGTVEHLAQWPVKFHSPETAGYTGITIKEADDALAERLNDLRLKTCEVTGRVVKATFEPKSTEGIPPWLIITLSDVSINPVPKQ